MSKSMEELREQLQKIKAEIVKKKKEIRYTGKISLEFYNEQGKKVKSFKGLDPRTANKMQRDLYKLIVVGLKQNISMKKVRESA